MLFTSIFNQEAYLNHKYIDYDIISCLFPEYKAASCSDHELYFEAATHHSEPAIKDHVPQSPFNNIQQYNNSGSSNQEYKKRKSNNINDDFSSAKKLKSTTTLKQIESIELSTLGESNTIQSPIVRVVESIQLPIVESNSIQLIPCSNPEDMYDYSINPQKLHEHLYINVSSPCEFNLQVFWSKTIQANPKELGKVSILFEQEGIHKATSLKSHFISKLPKCETCKISHILFFIKIGSILFHLYSKCKMKNEQIPSVIVLNVNNQSATLELAPKSKSGKRGNYQSGNFHTIKFK